jgi:hypothetical protein
MLWALLHHGIKEALGKLSSSMGLVNARKMIPQAKSQAIDMKVVLNAAAFLRHPPDKPAAK